MINRWSLWKQLKEKETGLGWDHVKATISANDEWWAMKVKENSKFDSFRDEGIEPELENRMDQIFGSYAQGKYKFSSVADSLHEQEVYVPSPLHRNDEHVSLDDMNLNNGDDNYYGGASWDDVWRESSPTPTPTFTNITQVTHVDRDDIRRGKRTFEGDLSQSNRSAKTSTKKEEAATIQQMLGDLMQQINERNTSTQEMNASMMNMMNRNMNVINSMNASTTKYGVEDALAKVCSLPGLEPMPPSSSLLAR
ncbi:PREDICTED: uncharacterized protein LOC109176830 [Ipomoea nil]|uniref:uncharacterized protein LOC109176830 n=1 Tax=Ipomoea nil TaxID=35883 RepID=UPI000901B26B|nr:PREDICTED: uncharacterized protein LOC109176830 [Ipomoea nil]